MAYSIVCESPPAVDPNGAVVCPGMSYREVQPGISDLTFDQANTLVALIIAGWALCWVLKQIRILLQERAGRF